MLFVLSLIPVLKQQFNELGKSQNSVKWVKVEQVKIKNRTYYFYSNTINIEEFNSSLLKIDKKIVQSYTYIYYIEYITSKNIGDCENI